MRQIGETFTRASHHVHAAETGAACKATLVRDVKALANKAPYQSAYTIAEQLLQASQPVPNQRSSDYLGRIANYHRQKTRPRHPQDLAFEINMEHWPTGFEPPVDVTVGTKRHILCFTNEQLTLLSNARRWFADGTFKIVRSPFTQLWGIHAFIRVGDNIKQVPLLFAVMSSKRRRDYIAILRALKGEMNRRGLVQRVECITMDFEAAAWAAFRAEFPNINVRGCAFHWGQAVWRQIQALGMQQAYVTDKAFHCYCKKLLALSYIPWETITDTFNRLELEATTDGQHRLCEYIKRTWINSSVWPPASWSCFYRVIRTNNDVEGWHRRLNAKASSTGNLNLYLMLDLLSKESRLVTLNCQLLKESRMLRRHRKDEKSTNARLYKIWDRIVTKEISSYQAIRAASHFVPF